jgi:hypothetical protein
MDHCLWSTQQLNNSKHLFMFNLDFLKITDFRSIEFVETLNQREFDGLPSFFYSICIFWSYGMTRQFLKIFYDSDKSKRRNKNLSAYPIQLNLSSNLIKFEHVTYFPF